MLGRKRHVFCFSFEMTERLLYLPAFSRMISLSLKPRAGAILRMESLSFAK